jgi:hypothetical protein
MQPDSIRPVASSSPNFTFNDDTLSDDMAYFQSKAFALLAQIVPETR